MYSCIESYWFFTNCVKRQHLFKHKLRNVSHFKENRRQIFTSTYSNYFEQIWNEFCCERKNITYFFNKLLVADSILISLTCPVNNSVSALEVKRWVAFCHCTNRLKKNIVLGKKHWNYVGPIFRKRKENMLITLTLHVKASHFF